MDGMFQHDVSVQSGRIVTPDGILSGRIQIAEGQIQSIEEGLSDRVDTDWGDDLIIPGLIDIHTDNLEKHFMPRPDTYWDAVGAAIAHDGQVATAGITTVYDSLSLHGRKNGMDRGKALPEMLAGLDKAEEIGALKIDHQLHLRCEVSNPELFNLLGPHKTYPRLTMLSIMDHTPGQGQSGSMERYIQKHKDKGKTDAEIKEHLEEMMSWRDTDGGLARRHKVSEIAQEHNIPLASHDDGTREAVDLAKELKCTIAEFPVSNEAAERAKELDMFNVMGGPNFVRGASHGGNASAREVAEKGLLDALCSDYVPLSMIKAAFMLTEAPFNWPIEKAISTVTAAPADMSNLSDRGRLKAGLRADFLRIKHTAGEWPIIAEVWSKGRRVV